MDRTFPSLALSMLCIAAVLIACTYDYEGATRCGNAVRDGDESGIDCGGQCSPCTDAGQGGTASDSGAAGTAGSAGGPPKLLHRWENLGLALEPPRRSCHVLAARPAEAELLVFSGYFPTADNDTWIFDGTSWSKSSPAGTLPGARRFAMGAHDESQGLTVVAGGWANSTPLNDAWAWNGSAWAQLPDLPGGRYGGGMVWDASTQRLLAVSSVSGAIELLELDFKQTGPEWVYLSASGPAPPGEMQYFELAFDRKRALTVLFVRGETWEFDRGSKSWTHRTSDGPGDRRGSGLAYDEHRERVVLFGGRRTEQDGTFTVRADTWEYDGLAWQEVTPDGQPPARWEGELAYDAPRRRMLLFGGGDGVTNPPPPFAQAGVTWAYYILGQPCTSGAECGNGICTDGVCCRSASCPSGTRCDTEAKPGDCAEGP